MALWVLLSSADAASDLRSVLSLGSSTEIRFIIQGFA